MDKMDPDPNLINNLPTTSASLGLNIPLVVSSGEDEAAGYYGDPLNNRTVYGNISPEEGWQQKWFMTDPSIVETTNSTIQYHENNHTEPMFGTIADPDALQSTGLPSQQVSEYTFGLLDDMVSGSQSVENNSRRNQSHHHGIRMCDNDVMVDGTDSTKLSNSQVLQIGRSYPDVIDNRPVGFMCSNQGGMMSNTISGKNAFEWASSQMPHVDRIISSDMDSGSQSSDRIGREYGVGPSLSQFNNLHNRPTNRRSLNLRSGGNTASGFQYNNQGRSIVGHNIHATQLDGGNNLKPIVECQSDDNDGARSNMGIESDRMNTLSSIHADGNILNLGGNPGGRNPPIGYGRVMHGTDIRPITSSFGVRQTPLVNRQYPVQPVLPPSNPPMYNSFNVQQMPPVHEQYFVQPVLPHSDPPMYNPFNGLKIPPVHGQHFVQSVPQPTCPPTYGYIGQTPTVHGQHYLQPVPVSNFFPSMSSPTARFQNVLPYAQAVTPSNYTNQLMTIANAKGGDHFGLAGSGHVAQAGLAGCRHGAQTGKAGGRLAVQAGPAASNPPLQNARGTCSRVAKIKGVTIQEPTGDALCVPAQGKRTGLNKSCNVQSSVGPHYAPSKSGYTGHATTSLKVPEQKAATTIPGKKHEKLLPSYKQARDLIHHIRCQDIFVDPPLEPLGERCQLCGIDLAFRPAGSDSYSRGLPDHAVLPCGHCFHDSCLGDVYGPMDSSQFPLCIRCSEAEAQKKT